jgi:hypothetical protein
MCLEFGAPIMMWRYPYCDLGCDVKTVLGLWLVVFCPLAYAAPCPAGQAKDENALIQIEHAWAGALEQRDPDALSCILAREFEDADPQEISSIVLRPSPKPVNIGPSTMN